MKGTVTEMTVIEEVTIGRIQDGFQRQRWRHKFELRGT